LTSRSAAARAILERNTAAQGNSDLTAQMVGTMVFIRLAKVAIIGSLAAFAFIVAYDNVVDYGSNYEFVRHVLSMDTTFPGNGLMHRAIADESIWRAAYALIIATEGLTALLLALGAVMLLGRFRAPARDFNRAKVWAVAGLTVGFTLWFLGFMVVAGEYFAMWQSKEWNGLEAAFRIATVILAALIFVSLPDSDVT
jgi:predicted small integral membrane protein